MMMNGQQARIRQRIAERRDWLFRLAMAWTGESSRADDLVQDALAKCLRRVPELRDTDRLDAWLFAVMRNCWRDEFRDRWRQRVDLDDGRIESDRDGPREASSRTQTVERVQAAVDSLPGGQREVVILVDLKGFSYAEVAESLALPVGTVMSRLCRARKRLATLLRDEQPAVPTGDNVTRFRRHR